MREIVLNKNTMIVSETNSKGLINYANDDFCKIAGYTKEELIGQPHNKELSCEIVYNCLY